MYVKEINQMLSHFDTRHWCPNCNHELNGMELDEQECHNCNWAADEEKPADIPADTWAKYNGKISNGRITFHCGDAIHGMPADDIWIHNGQHTVDVHCSHGVITLWKTFNAISTCII